MRKKLQVALEEAVTANKVAAKELEKELRSWGGLLASLFEHVTEERKK